MAPIELPDQPWVPPGTTVPACIAWWAEATPDARALLGIDGRELTYRELHGAIEAFVRGCAELGIGRGDRVLLDLPDGMISARVLLAAMRAATAVPVSTDQPAADAAAILAKVAPRAVIAMAGEASTFRESAARSGVPVIEVDANGALLPGQRSIGPALTGHAEPAPDDLALILLTSGTTDLPRAVPVRHDALAEVCIARVMIRELTRYDRGLNTAPSSFVVGISRTIESLISGGSALVVPPAAAIAHAGKIRELRPTWTWMSPALLELIVAAAEHEPAIREWPLRMVRCGGTRLPPALEARVEALWRVPALNGYGTTETLGFISAEEYPERIPRKPGSAGQVRPGLDLAIRSGSGAPLPHGETGEITVRTETLFTGYLDDPEATAAIFFPGGWYRTGDLGHLDHEGYLFVTGRVREMINRGGEKIVPHEIDDALRAHPAVADAAAFALTDPRLGEEVAAAVVLRDGATMNAREVRRWLAGRLAVHKIPRRIEFLEALPRPHQAKCSAAR